MKATAYALTMTLVIGAIWCWFFLMLFQQGAQP